MPSFTLVIKCVAALVCLGILLSGCGQAFLPERTRGNVSSSEIVGTWQYYDLYHKNLIKIEFKPSGEFVQTVPSDKIVHTGKWSLEGSVLKLDGVLVGICEGKGGSPVNDSWWIIDGHSGTPHIIFGGDGFGDPDQWENIEKAP
jgi:hypothetical protein